MRSFVSAPMRRGRLFLAGDAAHIVPPTGAKGLNLAVADVTLLATALVRLLQEKQTDLVDSYSDRALARVWRCTHFSWFMTSMLHRSGDDFDAAAAALPARAGSARPRRPPASWPRTTPASRSTPEPAPGSTAGNLCQAGPMVARSAGGHTVLASTDGAAFASLRSHVHAPGRSATRSGGRSGGRSRARRWPTGTGPTGAPTPSSR